MTGSSNVPSDTAGTFDLGIPGGVATLDGTGSIPAGQLGNAGAIGSTYTQPAPGGVAQTFTQFAIVPAGTTDVLGPFSSLFSVQTYGTSPPIKETAWMQGYNLNPSYGAPAGTYKSGNGSIYSYFHPDAGDTNIGGAHGLEYGIGITGPNQVWVVNAFQVIAVNDSDKSVGLTFRYSSGTSDGTDNTMNFINAKTGVSVLRFSYGGSGDTANSAVNYWLQEPASGTGHPATFEVASPDQGVIMYLDGFTSLSAVIQFRSNGTNKWAVGNAGSTNSFEILDNSSSNYAAYIVPVASDVPLFRSQSTFRVETGSLIVGAAAVATTATRGFLYLPSCAGAPTGVPVTQTGTVPCVLDSTDSKLYAYIGGSWVSATLA
jgi:hypothetical protein